MNVDAFVSNVFLFVKVYYKILQNKKQNDINESKNVFLLIFLTYVQWLSGFGMLNLAA